MDVRVALQLTARPGREYAPVNPATGEVRYRLRSITGRGDVEFAPGIVAPVNEFQITGFYSDEDADVYASLGKLQTGDEIDALLDLEWAWNKKLAIWMWQTRLVALERAPGPKK